MTRLIVNAGMFAGNFIKELPSKRLIKKGRPNGTLIRYVELKCLQCLSPFEVTLHNARRIQQKCCGTSCAKKYVEDFPGGNEQHPLYCRWLSMTQRVTNPNSDMYYRYGGRGIKILDNLDCFKEYVDYLATLPGYIENPPKSVQVDRIDNEGNYCKGNLRWTCCSTQTANQGKNSRGANRYTGVTWSKIHNRWIARVDFKGKTYCSSVHEFEESALAARNECIRANKLPHPIQVFIP